MEKVQQKEKNRNSKAKSGSKGGNVSQSMMKSPLMQQQAKTQASLFGDTVQKQENKTGLPDNLKSGMESFSGLNLDNVKVHYNSSKPAAVQAYAFAQGSHIHLASGQEKHLPHELGHVVQQMQGKVKPTTTVGGVAVNDNPSLEKQATVMGNKAMQMKSKTEPTVQKKPSDVVQKTSISGREFRKHVVHVKADKLNSAAIDSIDKENSAIASVKNWKDMPLEERKKEKDKLFPIIDDAIAKNEASRDKSGRNSKKIPFYNEMIKDLEGDKAAILQALTSADDYSLKELLDIKADVVNYDALEKTTWNKIWGALTSDIFALIKEVAMGALGLAIGASMIAAVVASFAVFLLIQGIAKILGSGIDIAKAILEYRAKKKAELDGTEVNESLMVKLLNILSSVFGALSGFDPKELVTSIIQASIDAIKLLENWPEDSKLGKYIKKFLTVFKYVEKVFKGFMNLTGWIEAGKEGMKGGFIEEQTNDKGQKNGEYAISSGLGFGDSVVGATSDTMDDLQEVDEDRKKYREHKKTK